MWSHGDTRCSSHCLRLKNKLSWGTVHMLLQDSNQGPRVQAGKRRRSELFLCGSHLRVD
eukprot:SAG11_NODE_6209_length_1364_cov_0.692490_2_plen_58_part_01